MDPIPHRSFRQMGSGRLPTLVGPERLRRSYRFAKSETKRRQA
jgi:hypothetical protein